MQRRVAIWILGAFRTFLIEGVKTITGIIPITILPSRKLLEDRKSASSRLLTNHILRSLMDDSPPSSILPKPSLYWLVN